MYLINWVAGLQMSRDCLSMLNFSVQFVPRSVWRGSTWSGRRRSCLAVHLSFDDDLKKKKAGECIRLSDLRWKLLLVEICFMPNVSRSRLLSALLSQWLHSQHYDTQHYRALRIAQIFSCTQSAWFSLTSGLNSNSIYYVWSTVMIAIIVFTWYLPLCRLWFAYSF